MRKLKVVMVFFAAAIVSGSLTLATKAHAWYKQVQAIQCAPYQTGFGFAGPDVGDMWVSGPSVANTGYRTINLTCPGLWDTTMWGVDDWHPIESMRIHAVFEKWYAASQTPRVQVCGYWGCSYWYYGDPYYNTPYSLTTTLSSDGWTVYMDFWAGPWRPESMNTIVVGLDATYQDWGRVMFFEGFTVGNEFGKVPPS
jgi:hypothetical protein